MKAKDEISPEFFLSILLLPLCLLYERLLSLKEDLHTYSFSTFSTQIYTHTLIISERKDEEMEDDREGIQ